jgi:hypothetical protein
MIRIRFGFTHKDLSFRPVISGYDADGNAIDFCWKLKSFNGRGLAHMHTQDDLVAARRMAVETHIDHAYLRMVDVGLDQNIESLPGSPHSFRLGL